MWVPPTPTPCKDMIIQRSLYELFLLRITLLAYLLKSEAVRLFLQSASPYKDTIRHLADVTYSSICPAYLNFCGDYCTPVDMSKSKALDSYRLLFTEGLEKLQAFHAVGKDSQRIFSAIRQGDIRLQAAISGYEIEHSDAKEPISTPETRNPYDHIHTWAKREKLEYEAMLQALDGRLRLVQLRAKHEAKIQKATVTLESLQAGHFALTAFLHLRSKEDLQEQETASVKRNTEQLSALEKLLLCCSNRLLEVDIPQFQAERARSYRQMMRDYASCLALEAAHMAEEARALAPSRQ